MLFNSQIFLLAFLPVTVLVWYRVAGHERLRVWTLVAASFFFYGWWEARLVPLLATSILVNWLLARHAPRRALAALGVTVNLAVLGVFKYADFFANALSAVVGTQHHGFGIVLPLGISFFTFQQISYLVDRGRGRAPRYGLGEYALFVSFFPQLIAGPIVRHGQIIGQYRLHPLREGLHARFARGLLLLVAGLAKKVALADQLARIADPVFERALEGSAVATADAWAGTFAFGFQIYFDFSGYSDMAIGLALLFGLSLPVNFNAPYTAASISDFWRRWHITLSGFLRDYLYIPLGGLWHGAAWTFVAWGGLHGLALCIDHAAQRRGVALPRGLGRGLTLAFVMLAWIPFRAEGFEAALTLFESLWWSGGAAALTLDRTWLLLPALGCAVLGPTSQQLALDHARPRLGAAFAAGIALMVLTLGTGGWRSAEFIYFQF
jgi:D-alanyl-lipoteichoic acid acyltransferase DltB (MBOAT superfamily)